MISPSHRSDIAPFHVMDVFEHADRLVERGADVVRLEVGQPLTAAPKGVVAAAHRALDADRLGYTSPRGIPALREALAAHYDDWYGVDIDPDRIVVTVGASAGFTLAFLSAYDIGDRVAVTIPGYPCYRNALEALGVEVVPLMTTLDDNFQPTVDMLEAAGPLDGLVLTSPSNPTGTMIDSETLGQIIGWCETNEVVLVSDEIYHGLTYGAAASTALAHGDDLIVVSSFSKYFSMTGWRLGWAIVPEAFVGAMTRFASNLLLAPATLSQLAAVAAFDCHDELGEHLDRYRHNRQILLEGLPQAGLDRLAPAEGAFYIYADVSHLTDDSRELGRLWLDEIGVAAALGVDFDPWHGDQFLRLSFCGATDDMHRAVERLARWSQASG